MLDFALVLRRLRNPLSERQFGQALLDQIEASKREARERAAEQHRALSDLIAGINKLRVRPRFAAAHESLLNALEAQLPAQDAYLEAVIEGDLNAFPGAFAEWTGACAEVQRAGRQLNQLFGVADPPASRASRIRNQLLVVVCAIALVGVGEAVGSSGGSSGNAAGRVIGAPIAVPRFPASIAIGRGDLWVGNDMDAYPSNSVTRIDARTGKVITNSDAGGSAITALSVAGGYVWELDSGIVTRNSTSRSGVVGTPINTVVAGLGSLSTEAMAFGDGDVWIANPGGTGVVAHAVVVDAALAVAVAQCCERLLEPLHDLAVAGSEDVLIDLVVEDGARSAKAV